MPNNATAPLHFVAHSMGGLLARVYVATAPAGAARPRRDAGHAQRRQRGRRSPEGLALYRDVLRPGRPAADDHARTGARRPAAAGLCRRHHRGKPHDRSDRVAFVLPRPNDGRVSLQSAKLAGMTDHIAVKASHTGLLRHAVAIEQTIAFLREGRFQTA